MKRIDAHVTLAAYDTLKERAPELAKRAVILAGTYLLGQKKPIKPKEPK